MLKKFAEEITLYVKTKTGEDELGAPIYEEKPLKVSNVLIGQPSSTDIASNESIYGKKAVYKLAIPKGDTHEWQDSIVEFYGNKWRVFTIPTEGKETTLPLYWNKQVMVERYE